MKTNREFIGRHPFIHEIPKHPSRVSRFAGNVIKKLVDMGHDSTLYTQQTALKTDFMTVQKITGTLPVVQLVAAGPMAHESMQVTSTVRVPSVQFFIPAQEVISFIPEQDSADSDELLVMTR